MFVIEDIVALIATAEFDIGFRSHSHNFLCHCRWGRVRLYVFSGPSTYLLCHFWALSCDGHALYAQECGAPTESTWTPQTPPAPPTACPIFTTTSRGSIVVPRAEAMTTTPMWMQYWKLFTI